MRFQIGWVSQQILSFLVMPHVCGNEGAFRDDFIAVTAGDIQYTVCQSLFC